MATDLDLLFISLYWMNVKVMVLHDVRQWKLLVFFRRPSEETIETSDPCFE